MKKLLIVVDYQKDFVTGSLGFPGALALEDPIARKISEYKAAGDDILFTLDIHTKDYRATQEGQRLPIVHCVAGTPGAKLYGKVGAACEPGMPCIEKPAFGSLALGDFLREHPYQQVELVGLVSYICVLSNAVIAKAALPEARIVIDAACTAGADAGLHEKALDLLETLQVDVVNRRSPDVI